MLGISPVWERWGMKYGAELHALDLGAGRTDLKCRLMLGGQLPKLLAFAPKIARCNNSHYLDLM